MSYTPEQKEILNTAKFTAFYAGFRRGCCTTGFIMSIMCILAFSTCGNKPMDKDFSSLLQKSKPVQKQNIKYPNTKTNTR